MVRGAPGARPSPAAALPGEDLGGLPGADVDLILVRQIEPGMRARQSFAWHHSTADFLALMEALVDECNEATAHALFDLKPTRTPTTIAALRAAVERYRTPRQ